MPRLVLETAPGHGTHPAPNALSCCQAIFTPEDCVPEFPTDGNLPSYLPWDIVNMTATSLTEQLTAADQSACQAACSANTKCQYFVWYAYKGAINAASQAQCYLRLAPQAIAPVAFTASSTNIVAFEVRLRNADSCPGRFMSTRCRHAPRARDAQLHSTQLNMLSTHHCPCGTGQAGRVRRLLCHQRAGRRHRRHGAPGWQLCRHEGLLRRHPGVHRPVCGL